MYNISVKVKKGELVPVLNCLSYHEDIWELSVLRIFLSVTTQRRMVSFTPRSFYTSVKMLWNSLDIRLFGPC
jgi:hypothetical protein